MNCPNEYTCAACNQTYHRDPEVWTEEDARNEFRKVHGRDVGSTDVVICDDCYQKAIKLGLVGKKS